MSCCCGKVLEPCFTVLNNIPTMAETIRVRLDVMLLWKGSRTLFYRVENIPTMAENHWS